MQGSRLILTLFSKNRFVVGSGYVRDAGCRGRELVLTLFLKTVLISVSIGCVLVYYIYYYLIGADLGDVGGVIVRWRG